jgi:hypothetical protein
VSSSSTSKSQSGSSTTQIARSGIKQIVNGQINEAAATVYNTSLTMSDSSDSFTNHTMSGSYNASLVTSDSSGSCLSHTTSSSYNLSIATSDNTRWDATSHKSDEFCGSQGSF